MYATRVNRTTWLSVAALLALLPASAGAQGGSIGGTVVDPLGARVVGTVNLYADGALISQTTSATDGSYTFTGLDSGRYRVEAAAPGFQSSRSDAVFLGESGRLTVDIGVRIGPLNQRISVTAAATALPVAQIGAPVSILDLQLIEQLAKPDVLEPLRMVPGLSIVQTGARGGSTSVFTRGGDSNFTKVLIDGAAANDMGGDFDFDALSTTGVESVEVLRTANSVLYGGDAMSGVINVVTRRGRTRLPEVAYAVDLGNLATMRNALSIGQAIGRFNYFVTGSRYDTDNNLPNNEYRNDTFASRFDAVLGDYTTFSGTIRRAETRFESPNAILYFGIPDDSTTRVRQTYATFSAVSELDRVTASFRYAYTGKDRVFGNLTPTGEPYDPFNFGFPNYLGDTVTIEGENGYSVTGRAILDYGFSTFGPSTFTVDTRRHIFSGQADLEITDRAGVSFGGRIEDEAGGTVHRRNHGYFVDGRGSVGQRFYLNGGLGFEDHAVFGFELVPRVSAAFYARRPTSSTIGETKLTFTTGKGIKAPATYEEQSSLLEILKDVPHGDILIRQFGIGPINAERTRSIDLGLEQVLWEGKVRAGVSYFNNRNENLIEGVGPGAMVQLQIPQEVIDASGGFASVNSQSFDAQGVEVSGEVAMGRSVRILAWYTFLDAEITESLSVSRSFNPAFPDIPIGAFSPLIGARPFRRPTHSGAFAVSYFKGPALISLTGHFVGRQDDSTFLDDPDYGPSMLLPNKDLSGNYQKFDLGGSYAIHRNAKLYASVENLLNQDYRASGGFPALPFNARAGLQLTVGGDPE